MSVMDDYLDGLAPEQDAALARVREIVAELVRDAEEGKSYGMPAFIYAGRLDGFDLAKGTIRFTPDHLVPQAVLADIIRHREREITAPS